MHVERQRRIADPKCQSAAGKTERESAIRNFRLQKIPNLKIANFSDSLLRCLASSTTKKNERLSSRVVRFEKNGTKVIKIEFLTRNENVCAEFEIFLVRPLTLRLLPPAYESSRRRTIHPPTVASQSHERDRAEVELKLRKVGNESIRLIRESER